MLNLPKGADAHTSDNLKMFRKKSINKKTYSGDNLKFFSKNNLSIIDAKFWFVQFTEAKKRFCFEKLFHFDTWISELISLVCIVGSFRTEHAKELYPLLLCLTAHRKWTNLCNFTHYSDKVAR